MSNRLACNTLDVIPPMSFRDASALAHLPVGLRQTLNRHARRIAVEDGVAEPVIGPAQLGRTRWLAYVAGIHALLSCKHQRRGWPEQVRP